MSQLAPILVVDDDREIRLLMCDLLAVTGYPVVTANDGAMALDILQRQSVALIFLDMKMPVMDGWAFARELQARITCLAPVVVLTAARDPSVWAARVGAIASLGKPFELEYLLLLVKRHATGADSAATNRSVGRSAAS